MTEIGVMDVDKIAGKRRQYVYIYVKIVLLRSLRKPDTPWHTYCLFHYWPLQVK